MRKTCAISDAFVRDSLLRTVLVWLSTCIPYQLNFDYAIMQYRTNASEIAHLIPIVCSGLNELRALFQQQRLYAVPTAEISAHFEGMCQIHVVRHCNFRSMFVVIFSNRENPVLSPPPIEERGLATCPSIPMVPVLPPDTHRRFYNYPPMTSNTIQYIQ